MSDFRQVLPLKLVCAKWTQCKISRFFTKQQRLLMTFAHLKRGRVAGRKPRVLLLTICLVAGFGSPSFAGQQSTQPASQTTNAAQQAAPLSNCKKDNHSSPR